jgi:hypothetical protein
VIDSADHIFSHGPMRDLLERVLSDGLFARVSRDGGNDCAELKKPLDGHRDASHITHV